MDTDYAIYYAMRLEINNQLTEPRLIVYENDHDDDNALKNINEHRAEGALQDFLYGLNVVGSVVSPELAVLNIGSLIATGKSFLGLIQGPNNTIIWSTGVKGGIALTGKTPSVSASLYFNRQENSDNWSYGNTEHTGFSELATQIERIYQNELKEYTDMNPVEDPSSSYLVSMNIKAIIFPELRFQTYNDSGWDDTHSDNFRFNNAQIIYDFKVEERGQ